MYAGCTPCGWLCECRRAGASMARGALHPCTLFNSSCFAFLPFAWAGPGYPPVYILLLQGLGLSWTSVTRSFLHLCRASVECYLVVSLLYSPLLACPLPSPTLLAPLFPSYPLLSALVKDMPFRPTTPPPASSECPHADKNNSLPPSLPSIRTTTIPFMFAHQLVRITSVSSQLYDIT